MNGDLLAKKRAIISNNANSLQRDLAILLVGRLFHPIKESSAKVHEITYMNRVTGHITARPIFDSNGILLDTKHAKVVKFTSLVSFFDENKFLTE